MYINITGDQSKILANYLFFDNLIFDATDTIISFNVLGLKIVNSKLLMKNFSMNIS